MCERECERRGSEAHTSVEPDNERGGGLFRRSALNQPVEEIRD